MPTTDRLHPLLVRAAVATGIVGAGLGVRAFFDGAFAKYAGVGLYAALVHVLVVTVRPSLRPAVASAAAAGICAGVELFQLTPIPARLAAEHPAFALVLGTTFHWPDLMAYIAGATVAAGVHGLVRARPGQKPV
jgi:hypothetical protein